MVDGGVFSLEELTVWWWKGDGDFKCLHCPKSWECYFLSLPLSPSHGFLFCLSIFFTFPWIILCLLPLNPVHFHLLNHSHIRLILEFLPCGSGGKKKPACNVEDLGLIPGSGRSPGVRKWQPTPVFLSGEFHGHRSLAGYSSRGHKESDVTERLTLDTPRVRCCGCSGEQKRRASPLGASPFEEESQRLF